MFVIGSAILTLAALLNVTEVRRNTELDVEQYKLVITVLYTIGGVLFTVGSAFFHPALKEQLLCTCLEDAGSWLFVVGSVCYFGGAVLNLKKIGMEEGKQNAQHSTAHSTAPHRTAQHSTAQHGTVGTAQSAQHT
eukprot:COSAG06_NODE_9252_length_1946_cov_7.035734_1_plen_135_part_00